ncbi:DUF4304 domain-containing protein [Enhydrobacter sp.]|jgi:hypothetical protein|uniref:DUF4304 domain-containing protein n=1 Tax=Enhydrobacter sp. TaxID=1894999 RepID=UPI00262A3CF2|nr:DUF4304 domain-containing protein [Enhydrobacter sp.]
MKNAFVTQLDKVFEPLGFKRHKNVWNREVSSFVDVADIQMRKGGDACTLNVGVLDPDIHSTLWGEPRPRFVEQPTCTVAVRIGELIDGRDRWWSINDEGAIEDIGRTATAYALPFLERMHAREAMRQWLIETKVVQRRYLPPIINLAILENLLGDATAGCNLLSYLHQKAVGAWQSRIAEVAKRLNCASL